MKRVARGALIIVFTVFQWMLILPSAGKEKHLGTSLVAMTPSSVVYFESARREIKRGRHAEALVDLDCALMLAPNNYELLLAKAFELNRLARFEESENMRGLAALRSGGKSQTHWTAIVLQKCNQKKMRIRQRL